MALPSAQLGSLPSLNVPSYIPVIQVQKERKLRDQVLAQLATQLIGQAVGAGVGNLMERDYSAEVGETPSTGFDKLFHGAKNDEKTAAQKREITAREKLQKEGIAADAKREHGRQLFDIKKDTFQEKQRIATMEKGLEADEIKERMDYDRLMAELQSRENQQSQGIRAQSLRDQIEALKADKRLDKQLGAEKELNTARTKNLEADTAAREETNRIMRGQPDASGTNKAQRTVQDALQDTKKYPTADQLGVGKLSIWDFLPEKNAYTEKVADPLNAAYENQKKVALAREEQARQEAADPRHRIFQALVQAREAQRANPSPQNSLRVIQLSQQLAAMSRGEGPVQ